MPNPIPPIHLKAGNPNAVPNSGLARAYPVNVPDSLVRNSEKVVAYLNVRRSERYRASGASTYCNIYAHDYCTAMGVYLPRVWWTPDALEKFQAGETVAPVYAKTLVELNANALYDWLHRWGLSYGWEKGTFTEVQHHVNNGAVGVLCAARKDAARPGHIAVVVPETAKHGKAMWKVPTKMLPGGSRAEAERMEPECTAPLQCQAGAVNREYWTGAGWWEAVGLYRGFGCWYNVPEGERVT